MYFEINLFLGIASSTTTGLLQPPPNWEKNGEKIIFMVSDHRLRPSAPPIDYPFSCVYKCGIYNFSKEYSEKILVLSKNDHR